MGVGTLSKTTFLVSFTLLHCFICICRRGGEEAKCTKEVCKGGGRDEGGGKCDGKLAILD